MSKKEKAIFIAFVGISVIAIVLIFMCFIGKGFKKDNESVTSVTSVTTEKRVLKLNNNCVEIFYNGCNGEGLASFIYKDDVVKELVMDLVQPKEKYSLEWLKIVRKIREDVTVELSKSENLSNDDVIEVIINIPKEILDECMIEEVECQFDIVVSGLPEKKEIDPFENFHICAQENNGKIELVMFHTGEELRYYSSDYLFNYELDENAKLGDEIILTMNEEAVEELRNKGYICSRLTNTYVLDENTFIPLKNANEVSPEIIEKLAGYAKDSIKDVYSSYEFVKIEFITLEAAYFRYFENANPYNNKLSLIFKIDLLYENKTVSVYMMFTSFNLYIDNYGEISVLNTTNEMLKAYILIDPTTVLSVPGDKLDNIMRYLEGYEIVE